jgi:hypothetical protein
MHGNLPCCHRYELYLPFLEELQRQGVAGGVVLSDAADVVLQSDPWRDLGAQMLIAEVHGGGRQGREGRGGRDTFHCVATHFAAQRAYLAHAEGHRVSLLAVSLLLLLLLARLQNAILLALEGTPEEAEGKRIRDCAEATHLLEQCFNAGVAQQLGDRPLACPGVMVGSLGAITAYVRQLLEVAGSVATEECRRVACSAAFVIG